MSQNVPTWAEFVAGIPRQPFVRDLGPKWCASDHVIRDAFRPLHAMQNVWKVWTGGSGDVARHRYAEVRELAEALKTWCLLAGDSSSVSIIERTLAAFGTSCT